MHVMVIADIGAEHSTGNHLCRALEANGHSVSRINERPELWARLDINSDFDFVIWNSTPGYAPSETYEDQLRFIMRCRDYGCPIVGYHLDLFWGLPERERWVAERPFFRSDLVVTADGGHDEQWERCNVNHVWFPPAVLAQECVPGTYREEYAADVAFVGSWQPSGYHHSSQHRADLMVHLRMLRREGMDVKFWPPEGKPAIRGADLRDLYASTKVVVGDSCMVPHLDCYWSDRIPETTGRGAFLLHPFVSGMEHHHAQVCTWRAGDWEGLDEMLTLYLNSDGQREAHAFAARNETLAKHTYEHRMNQLVELLQEGGML